MVAMIGELVGLPTVEDPRMKRVLAAVCFLFLGAVVSRAADQDDIIGPWLNEEHDAMIEVFKCGKTYCGRIAWSKAPSYPPGDKKGRAGQPRMDDNNPDQDLRNRPIIGLQIMSGFTFDGNNGWAGGTLYDPKKGKTYRGKMTLVSPGELHLRGYVLFSFLGRTTTWTRPDH